MANMASVQVGTKCIAKWSKGNPAPMKNSDGVDVHGDWIITLNGKFAETMPDGKVRWTSHSSHAMRYSSFEVRCIQSHNSAAKATPYAGEHR